MRYIYNFILYLILPFLPLTLWIKSRKNRDYRNRINERFGYFNRSMINQSIWVHAVSVGELIAAVPLINGLLKKFPTIKVVVTTMTPTGARRAEEIFGNQIIHSYLPYDYPGAVKRFLFHFKPKILLIMETEIWPNLLHYTHRAKIPVIMVNARLSHSSFKGYQKFRFFIQPILNSITQILAQSDIDQKRFLALGIKPNQIWVTGNIKFDIDIPKKLLDEVEKLRLRLGKKRPIWVAASTHKGEEEKILSAFKKLLKDLPGALLILVPRHPERFNPVFKLCQQDNFKVVNYSQIENYHHTTNILLGDVMGKLLLFYGVSDVAFVGGSLVPWGGHNLLEPAALSKPVVAGTNLDAFLEISIILSEAGALIKVADAEELAKKLLELFNDQSLREKLGTIALDVVEKYRGITQKVLTVVQEHLRW